MSSLLRKKLDNMRGNRDNDMMKSRFFRQFWFYLMNPQGNFEEETTEIRTVSGAIPDNAPIILFVPTLEPVKLDFLRKK